MAWVIKLFRADRNYTGWDIYDRLIESSVSFLERGDKVKVDRDCFLNGTICSYSFSKSFSPV